MQVTTNIEALSHQSLRSKEANTMKSVRSQSMVHPTPKVGQYVESVFNENIHKPPRIDQFGYNKETHKGRELLNRNAKNILGQETQQNIPAWWTNKRIRDNKFKSLENKNQLSSQKFKVGSTSVENDQLHTSRVPKKFTRTQLMVERKQEAIPDITYDLDGDGQVSGRDYVLARKFDTGLKNYLTGDERRTAIKAIKDGFEDKFVWNVDAGGAQRQYRLQQVRGAIVDAEDYKGVTATYPPHPMSKNKPMAQTMTELSCHRKNIEKDDIKRKMEDRHSRVSHLQKVQFKDYNRPQEFVSEPQYTATWQKKRDERYNGRIKGGLTKDNIDINPEKLVDPTLKWVENTDLNLQGRRKTEILKELKKMEKNFDTHQEGQARIENREACILRLTYRGLDNVPYNQDFIKEKRKNDMIDDMTKKFGDQVLGVHGQELPHFEDIKADQQYWVNGKGFRQNPPVQSQNLLKQNQKRWAELDQVKLSDATEGPAPIDPFKVSYTKQHSKFNVPDKVTEVTHWENTNKASQPNLIKGFKPLLKWSEAESNYKCDGVDRSYRTFDKIVTHAEENDEREAQRILDMEDLIIKQAPRQLQMEVAQQISNEKKLQSSMMIGQRGGISTGIRGDNVRFGASDKGDPPAKKQDTKQPIEPKITAKIDKMNTLGTDLDSMNQTMGANAMATMTMQTGKLSLMGRMTSPTGGVQKDGKLSGNTTLNLGSTMASANISRGGTLGNKTHGSPFKHTIGRGMVTGVGFLNI